MTAPSSDLPSAVSSPIMSIARPYFKVIYTLVLCLPTNAQQTEITTRFINVGTAHASVDWAGILIDLNVAEAIEAGQQALQMVDTYIAHYKAKSLAVSLDGQYRHIHFVQLKSQQVRRKVLAVSSDMHEMQKQYHVMPNSDSSVNRQKRSVSFLVDIASCLKSVVDGVVSIFHAPSYSKLQKSVNKLASRTSRLENNMATFAVKMEEVLQALQEDIEGKIDNAHTVSSLFAALEMAESSLDQILMSINPLLRGQLTHYLLDPLNAHELLNATQSLAARYGLMAVVDQPLDLLRCEVTSFANNHSWYAILHLPLVNANEQLEAYEFVNLPFLVDGVPKQWNIEPGLVAVKAGLYPQVTSMFIRQQEMEKKCEIFQNNFLCHAPLVHLPTCQVALLHQSTDNCQIKSAEERFVYKHGEIFFVFFKEETQALVKCKNRHFNAVYHGLIDLHEFAACEIVTRNFTILPRAISKQFKFLVNMTMPVKLSVDAMEQVESGVLNKNTTQEQFKKLRDIFLNATEEQESMEDTMNYNSDSDFKIFGKSSDLINAVVSLVSLILSMCLTIFCLWSICKPFRALGK